MMATIVSHASSLIPRTIITVEDASTYYYDEPLRPNNLISV